MRPYYQDDWATVYLGDCQQVLANLDPIDHVITDPPYDERTHSNARASTVTHGISKKIDIDFAPLEELPGVVSSFTNISKRWVISFCALEMFGAYAAAAGESWIRSAFWHKPDGVPQFTGDRPAQPGEGIAIMHRKGQRRWNGGGKMGFYSFTIERVDRTHPTQKPIKLIEQLTLDFTDPGETILDPFMGSGTTLLAAKNLGRKSIGIEISEKYAAMAVKRLRQEVLPFMESA